MGAVNCDPPTHNTKHPFYTALILESFFFTLSDVLCVRCQYIGIHSGNVYFLFITENILEINNRGDRGVMVCGTSSKVKRSGTIYREESSDARLWKQCSWENS